MVRKKNAGRTQDAKSSRPEREEEPVPIQSIDPLAIVVYNPENIPPVASAVSTESDTSDEEQQIEENPDDEGTSNVAGKKNIAESSKDDEDSADEEISNMEENPTIEENPLESESEGVDVDTFVAEILAKAKAESSAGSSKRQKMMARKTVPSWYPPRPPSKVVPPPIKRRSSRIRSKIPSDPNYEPETVDLSDDDEGNADPVVPSVTTKGKKGVSKTPKKSVPKVQEKSTAKKTVKQTAPKVKPRKSSRYVPPVPGKSNTFHDAKSKSIWKYVIRRKICSERLIDQKDHEKIGIIKLLRERKLLDSVSFAKPYNRVIVQEFYTNLKKGISDDNSPFFESVYVRGHMFEFSPLLISSMLNCPIVKSSRKKELDLNLDLHKVAVELTSSALTHWPTENAIPSAVLTSKYSILHKIAIANWLPRLHISTVSKDLAILLFAIGTGEEFDLAKVIFQVIVSNAESENTVNVLPYPSLIFEILRLQHDIMEEGEVLEQPRHPIKISTKLYQGAHIPDVDDNLMEEEPDSPVADPVATDAANVTSFQFLSFQLVQIRKRRLEVAKRLKTIRLEHIQLRDESVQLAAHEACVKRLMEQHPDEEDTAPVQSDDNDDE